jgi:hypothetical protein
MARLELEVKQAGSPGQREGEMLGRREAFDKA